MTARATAQRVDVDALVRRELDGLVRYARRFSYSRDDAEDACQRAVELLVRHDGRIEEQWALAWLRTVAKHEAFASGRARRRVEPVEQQVLDRVHRADAENVEDLCERIDLRERARRALPRLKPQERCALGLLAAGHSYREICAMTGWTYTKVNRCIREGRAALRAAARDGAEPAFAARPDNRMRMGSLADSERAHRLCIPKRARGSGAFFFFCPFRLAPGHDVRGPDANPRLKALSSVAPRAHPDGDAKARARWPKGERDLLAALRPAARVPAARLSPSALR